MTWVLRAILAALVVAGVVVVGRSVAAWLRRGPDGRVAPGIVWLLIRLYCRLMHRPTYEGLELVPPTNRPGPLIVVSNHTSGVDVLLIQAVCRFEIRWMMARDQMQNAAEAFWRWRRLIPVERDGRDTRSAREAIRHVKEGGVVGIFPEGGIEHPARHLRPFLRGVGLVIARTRAPVLLVWVTDTPICEHAFGALTRRSRARVKFVEMIDFSREMRPDEITNHIRARLAEVSGWPLNDEVLPHARREAPDPFAP